MIYIHVMTYIFKLYPLLIDDEQIELIDSIS